MNSILHVSSAHGPNDPRIVKKECATLVQSKQYEVGFVTPVPGTMSVDGVSFYKVIENKSRFYRFTAGLLNIYREIKLISPKVCHLHDPDLLILAPFLSRLQIKVIFDSHENVSLQILSKYWLPAFLRRAIAALYRKLETIVIKSYVDLVVGATSLIASDFENRGIRAKVVNNFPIINQFESRAHINFESRLNGVNIRLVYVGLISIDRGVETLVRLAEKEGIELHLVGRFESDALKKYVSDLSGWASTIYYDEVPHEYVGSIIGGCDLGMALLRPSPNYIGSLPTKIFEYMLQGLPVIHSDIESFSRSSGISGCAVAYDDINEIYQAITSLVSDKSKYEKMSISGRNEVYKNFNWESEGRKLLGIYTEIMRT